MPLAKEKRCLQGISEMIAIAENKRFRENLAKQHNTNAGFEIDLEGIDVIPGLLFRFLVTMERF